MTPVMSPAYVVPAAMKMTMVPTSSVSENFSRRRTGDRSAVVQFSIDSTPIALGTTRRSEDSIRELCRGMNDRVNAELTAWLNNSNATRTIGENRKP